MRTKQERYFICKVLFPFQEIIQLIIGMDNPTYFDDEYSPLIDKIENMCIQMLNIFEQKEFYKIYGKEKRDSLNNNSKEFHRILSLGIKSKHGEIKTYYLKYL